MELRFLKTPYGLFPENPETERQVANLRTGDVLKAQFIKVRNPKFHRKFMALVKLAFDLWEEWVGTAEVLSDYGAVKPEVNFNEFRYWLTIKAGFYYMVVYPDGAVRARAKSIKFAKMGDHEFEVLYSKVIDVVLKDVLKGSYDRAKLEQAVHRILHFI